MFPKILFCFLLPFLSPGWNSDFSKAQEEAKSSNRFILLNFSGSDWCPPCIRMHKTFFESNEFETFADKELVLINADFPRLSKNQLSKELQKQNDGLAERYDPEGKFPLTLLLDEDGKIVHSWDGCPNEQPQQFVAEIDSYIHAGGK